MTIRDNNSAFLANELVLQNSDSSASIAPITTDVTNDNPKIGFSDEWSSNTDKFNNSFVEKIDKVSISDLVDIPNGISFDSDTQTLLFSDDSLTKQYTSGCKLPNSDTISLNDLVSDIDTVQILDKINNFGDIYDFQFKQINYGSFKFPNAKIVTSLTNIVGYYSLDKLVNDEFIRKQYKDNLYNIYKNTDKEALYPPYSGVLNDKDYTESGWLSIDQIIRSVYSDSFAYDADASINIKTPKILDAKRAFIFASLSYTCDIFKLNSFNKLSDFGLRLVDRTTGTELSRTAIKSNLIDKITNCITLSYNGKLNDVSLENSIIANSPKKSNCQKININKCDGSLFTVKENVLSPESDGFSHEFDVQFNINPIQTILNIKPDILNTVDPIHWTTGIDTAVINNEILNLTSEFGKENYLSGKLNLDRAFSYGCGDFFNGYAAGGYFHNDSDEIIGTTDETESWNGISWLVKSKLSSPRACGLSGGNSTTGIISQGINNSWKLSDKTFANSFTPSSYTFPQKSLILSSYLGIDAWNVVNDITPPISKHSISGYLNIIYKESKAGESIDSILDSSNVEICSEAISKAKQFASQSFSNNTELEVPNVNPRVWFNIWQSNGISFCGSTDNHIRLDQVSDSILSDEFEKISWIKIIKNTSNPDRNIETTQEENSYGCWNIDPYRKYPVKAFGVAYVGDNNSGLATGGKTGNSLIDINNNVKTNMRNYYLDINNFNENNLSVIPYTYENNGITWIRKENLPEPVYYHVGVGNLENSVFFGGIHATLENPTVNTTIRNCEDWDSMIRTFGGSFHKNGSVGLNGNIQFSHFSSLIDSKSYGFSDSYGNTYYKTRDSRDTENLGVVYSSEYINNNLPTIQSEYPLIKSYSDYADPEFTFPNKRIYSNRVSSITIEYNTIYYVPNQYKITIDLINDGVINSPKDLEFDLISGKVNIITLEKFKEKIYGYFDFFGITSKTITTNLIKTTVFSDGESRLLNNEGSEHGPSKHEELSIFEDIASDSSISKTGKFALYTNLNPEQFKDTYNPYENNLEFPVGHYPRKNNFLNNISYNYAGHPTNGGMWLWSRPSFGESLFDPKNINYEGISYSDRNNHSFGFSLDNNNPNTHTFFVGPKSEGLNQFLTTNDSYSEGTHIFVEDWNNIFKTKRVVKYLENDNINFILMPGGIESISKIFNINIDLKRKLLVDGTWTPELTKVSLMTPIVYRNGTISKGKFKNINSSFYSNFNSVVKSFSDSQFINVPYVNLQTSDYYPVINYDNSNYFEFNKFFDSSNKSSTIRDKSGLWPWNDLLQGDSSNSCVKNDYTFLWDSTGAFFIAVVTDVIVNNGIATEKITITKYNKNGDKEFDYNLEYADNKIFVDGSGYSSVRGEANAIRLFGDDIKQQRLDYTKYNSLHIYGNKQNFDVSPVSVNSFGWTETCKKEYDNTSISDYPFKYCNLGELLNELNYYNNTEKVQVYIEGNSYGKNSLSITPAKEWYNPKHKKIENRVKYNIPPQILNENFCGIRENLIRLRYNQFNLKPHSGVFIGDIRLMGEVDPCYTLRSIIAKQNEPLYDPAYNGVRGQPEFFMDNIMREFGVEWYNTSIATEFTSNLFARFKRDAIGTDKLDTEFVDNSGTNIYPFTYKDINGIKYNPRDIMTNKDIKDKSLSVTPNVAIVCVGLYDILFDKNYYETIFFLEEIAKVAQENNLWTIFLTIPPRPMMKHDIAIENHVWYHNLVGDGTLDDQISPIRSSSSNSPVYGDQTNVPLNFGEYNGKPDPFIGKTKLEKLVAINDWMKKKLPEYDHNVIDAYDFLVDKSLPVANQVKYIVTDDNLLEPTNEPIYGDIKPLFSNGVFENNEPTQFNGRLNGTSSKDLMIHIFNSVDLVPRFNIKILSYDDKPIEPKDIFISDNPKVPYLDRKTYINFYEVGVENTHLSPDKLFTFNQEMVKSQVSLKSNMNGNFNPLIHSTCEESLYFDLLCCILSKQSCLGSCYSDISNYLSTKTEDEYKWTNHFHEEWSVPAIESPFAGAFSMEEFNVWLTAGNSKNNRWGTNIWASNENGEITLHYRKQRVGISDPQAGYGLENGNWALIDSKPDRNKLYFSTLTAEIKISNLEDMQSLSPIPCRVFYDEFSFDFSVYYSDEVTNPLIDDILKLSYSDYSGEIEYKKENSTGYEVLGVNCDNNVSIFYPEESHINPFVSGKEICNSSHFLYAEWVSSFIQEWKSQKSLLDIQKDNKYFFKHNIEKYLGCNNVSNATNELSSDVKIVETSWRRYQDGVGLGGDAPLIHTETDKLLCNPLNTYFIGQCAFGTPEKAIVFGGISVPSVGNNNRSKSWWENSTTNFTFKWNKSIINLEDTFNLNYTKRGLSPFFSNYEISSSNSNMGSILYDVSNNILIERQGTAIFNGTNSIDVKLSLPEEIVNKDKYSIILTPSDNVNTWWEKKSENGFSIVVGISSWTGTVDWQIVLNDRIVKTNIDDSSKDNIPFDTYEGL